MSIVDDLENQVSSGWNSISSAGAPAVIAGAENLAIQTLQQDAAKNQAASQQAVNKAVQSGGPSSGLMASIQNVFGQVAQGAVFKQYGLYIIGGVIVLLIVGRRIL